MKAWIRCRRGRKCAGNTGRGVRDRVDDNGLQRVASDDGRLGALEAGLPQLLLPQGADHFINVEILAAAGAVRALTNDAQQSGAIEEAVRALLGDCRERQVAARLRDEIASMPAPADVVPVLVELAG